MKTLSNNTKINKPVRQIVIRGEEEISRLNALIDYISSINGNKEAAKSAINWITKQFEMDKISFNV